MSTENPARRELWKAFVREEDARIKREREVIMDARFSEVPVEEEARVLFETMAQLGYEDIEDIPDEDEEFQQAFAERMQQEFGYVLDNLPRPKFRSFKSWLAEREEEE